MNDANFLVDQTGNSRWWTIACDKLDFQHDIDTQQLFAQALAEVGAGEPWWLTGPEEDGLEAWNARHTSVSAVAEQLDEWLDHDLIGKPGVPAMTASEVLRLIGYERPTNPQAKECRAALRDLLGEPKNIRGRDRWRVPLRQGTADDLKPGPNKPSPRSAEPEEIF